MPRKAEITKLLSEFKIYNADVIFFENADTESLAEAMDGSITYIDSMIILNKIDTVDAAYADAIKKELESATGMKVIPVSASEGTNAETAKESIFEGLRLMRVYLKPKDGMVDTERPLILKDGSRVIDAARALHSKIAKSTRYAYLSGSHARFSNQKVGKEHLLHDGDVLTIIYDKS